MRVALTKPHLDQKRRRRSIDALVEYNNERSTVDFLHSDRQNASIFIYDSSLAGSLSAA